MHLTQSKPTQEQIAALMSYPKDKPVVMVNIIKYKGETESGESGELVYKRYIKNAMPFILKAQAKVLWWGQVQHTVIGDSEGQPDIIFMVEYPSVSNFLAMATNADYLAIATDRTMAIEYGGLMMASSNT